MDPRKCTVVVPQILIIAELSGVPHHKETEGSDGKVKAVKIIREAVARASMFSLAEINWSISAPVLSDDQKEVVENNLHKEIVAIARAFTPARKEDPDYTLSVNHLRESCFRVSMIRLPFQRC